MRPACLSGCTPDFHVAGFRLRGARNPLHRVLFVRAEPLQPRGNSALQKLLSVFAERSRAVQIQLRFDARAISLDRFDIEMERLRDFARAPALADELQDLEFAIAELFQG